MKNLSRFRTDDPSSGLTAILRRRTASLCSITLATVMAFGSAMIPSTAVAVTDSTSSNASADDRSSGSSIIQRQKILKNRLLFPHGKVLMTLPKRPTGEPMLRPLTDHEFDQHYGFAVRPEFAFIDDSTESRLSVSVTQTKLLPTGLDAYRKTLEKAISKSVKDIIWHKREILKFEDPGSMEIREWVHLEMQNIASDSSTLMNDFYVTSMGGHPLMFTITANTKEWYDIRKIMQKLMLSVTVQDLPATSDK